MKLLKYFLVVFFVAVLQAVGATSVPVKIWCENSQMYTSAFFVFDDNGRLLRAAGIDCFGNAWSREYNISTGSGNTPNAGVFIANLTKETLKVSANDVADFQIVDLTKAELPAIGGIYHISVAHESVSVDISALEAGTYGVLVMKDGDVMDILTFDKHK